MVTKFKSSYKEIKKGLYLVSTPIGNLNDITLRAIDTLKMSDYILCEDTRVSNNLLKRYDIKSSLISNHKFNEKKNSLKIIEILKKGKIVSLISDAGTPGVSDPGKILINECVKNDIDVIPVPGPSAVTSAISVSGFSEKFYFYGFFPEKKGAAIEDLKFLSKLNSSIVFFISPKKFYKIIPLIKEHFLNRKILICREMSKIYEEFLRIDVKDIDNLRKDFKGELTVVLSEKKDDKKNSDFLNESDKITIKKMINKLSIKEIVSIIKRDSKISKKEIYNYCIKLKNEN